MGSAVVPKPNGNVMGVFCMKDVDRYNIVVVNFNRAVIEFRNSLNFQVVSVASGLALTVEVSIKILSNVLREMLTILILSRAVK